MKFVYAHTGFSSTYPSYISVQAQGDATCGLKVIVRDHARMVETENGSHWDSGHTAETLLSPEHAMDLAKSIIHHYAPGTVFGYPVAKPGEDGIGEENRRRFFPDDHIAGETHRVYEETESVGELSHTRRLIIDSVDAEPLNAQIARLASFIMTNFPGEPSGELNEGAVDVAIRLLGDHAALLKVKKHIEDVAAGHSVDLIAEGLRKGQARHILGETQDVTTTHLFVDAGTHARPMTEAEEDAWYAEHQKPPLGPVPADIAAELAARDDGTNEPAVHSAPLGSIDVVGPQPVIVPPADVAAEDDQPF